METSSRPTQLRLSSVLLVLHVATVVILVATFAVMLRGPQVDANIGAGFVMLLLLPLGLPWSIAAFMPSVSVNQDAIVALAAILNLLLHGVIVYLVRSHNSPVSLGRTQP